VRPVGDARGDDAHDQRGEEAFNKWKHLIRVKCP
jgi:hypothetical protein